MTKASDLLVQALETEGVDIIFGVPGEENLDVLDSLSRSEKIRFVLCRHEQAAGFIAAAYGRFTGKAGVVMTTLGPGACNMVTAAAYAQLGGMPLLMLSGQKPIKESGQGRFQLLDVVNMMEPISKSSQQIVAASRIPAMVRDAMRIAQEEKPGLAHLELPEDIAEETTDAEPLPSQLSRRPLADPASIEAAASEIASAVAPLIVIGVAANRTRASKALSCWIDRCGIPFVTTQLGKGVVDEQHPLFLGNAALSSNDIVHAAIDAADLIINVGHDVVEKPPFIMRHGGTRVMHVSFQSASVDPVYFPQIEVLGDIAHSISAIDASLQVQPQWDFGFMRRVQSVHDEHLLRGSGDDRFPILPERMVADLHSLYAVDGIVCLDNGIYKLWFARNYRARKPNTVLLDNALATMGAGLPSAIAACLVYPEKPVLAVCGDGGFMMNSQELETAVRLQLNLVVLILVDNAYGMIRWKQADMGLTDFGLQYSNPDFAAYARSYGAGGHTLSCAADLNTVVQDCQRRGGVHVVACPVDYSENLAKLTSEVAALGESLSDTEPELAG